MHLSEDLHIYVSQKQPNNQYSTLTLVIGAKSHIRMSLQSIFILYLLFCHFHFYFFFFLKKTLNFISRL